MAFICFTYLVAERMLEMYDATFLSVWKTPEPIIILLEEEPPEPATQLAAE